jgi:hypothetical protein
VAIIQISRIQHRRGRGNPPQLSSGEIAWSVDDQQLYIGNGAVSEGAPYVGNTEILTEHSNIFELADQYAYKSDNNIWGVNVPIARSLQDRLDETVSVFSFGATGDGTDQTDQIQLAIDSLFKNSSVDNRVVLWFPAGIYQVSSTIELPPYAVVRGAGKEKTVFRSSTADVFKTIHYNPADPAETINEVDVEYVAKYIEVSDCSIEVDSLTKRGIVVDSCQNSIFKNLKIKGFWTFGDIQEIHRAIDIISYSDVKLSQNNIFDTIEIDNFTYGIYSDYYIKNNTFRNLRLELMLKAIAFGTDTSIGLLGMSDGPSYNLIEGCFFDRISEEAIFVREGNYNTSTNNRFFNVGNDQSNTARSPVIRFTTDTNISSSDFFERTQIKTVAGPGDSAATKFYTSEVLGRTNYSNLYGNNTEIGLLATDTSILKFPVVENGTIFVDYVYTEDSQEIVREGTIELVINLVFDSDLTTVDLFLSSVVLNDNYTFIGDSIYSTALVFTAVLESVNIIGVGTTTIVNLSAVNGIPVSNDNLYYTIRVKS